MQNNNHGQYIRFLNASDCDGIDFYMFNTLEFADAKPGSFCEYRKTAHGTCTFKACKAHSKEIVASTFADIKPDTLHIVCAVGSGDSLSLYAIEEKADSVDSKYAHLRICMLNSKTKPSDMTANGHNVICNISPMDVSEYVAFLPGTYTIELKKSGTDDVFVKTEKHHLDAGKRYSVFVCENNFKTIIL